MTKKRKPAAAGRTVRPLVGAWTPAWNRFLAEHGQPIDEIEMAHWHNAWGDDINHWVLMFMRRSFDAGRRSANKGVTGAGGVP